MTETKVKIRNEVGPHLRPAQQLCTKAMEYEGTKILIRFRGREFNAKSLLGLLSACVQQMDEIILVCDGPQEQRASEELAAFIEQELEGEVFRSVNTDREATAFMSK